MKAAVSRTAVVYGYAVIRDGKLRTFDRDEAIAVGFPQTRLGSRTSLCATGTATLVVLEIDSGGSEVTPVWSSTGELTGLNIAGCAPRSSRSAGSPTCAARNTPIINGAA